jgi:hypothetical protein
MRQQSSRWTIVVPVGISILALLVSLGTAFSNGWTQWKLAEFQSQQTALGTCFTWGQYVEDQHARHVPLRDIDRRGRWFTNYFVREQKAPDDSKEAARTITDVCGTAEGIVQGKGRPPVKRE